MGASGVTARNMLFSMEGGTAGRLEIGTPGVRDFAVFSLSRDPCLTLTLVSMCEAGVERDRDADQGSGRKARDIGAHVAPLREGGAHDGPPLGKWLPKLWRSRPASRGTYPRPHRDRIFHARGPRHGGLPLGRGRGPLRRWHSTTAGKAGTYRPAARRPRCTAGSGARPPRPVPGVPFAPSQRERRKPCHT